MRPTNMPKLRQKPRGLIQCIYCGQSKKPSKEHVIQDSIGGWDVLWEVCEPCNKGFSDMDENLAVNSPLSILAIRELGETGPRSWTTSPEMPDVLLEARGGKGTDAQALHAQLVFDGDKHYFWVDHDEIDRLGIDQVKERFYARLRNAFDYYRINGTKAAYKKNKTKDVIWLDHIERPLPGRRLPPRICCRIPVSEWDDSRLTFELVYHRDDDRRRILEKLSTFDWNFRYAEYKRQLGSHESTVHFPLQLSEFIRVVTKIGFNLLAYHCPSTAPSNLTFRKTVEWITQGRHLKDFGDDMLFGFVRPSDVASMNCPAGAHMFRFLHNPVTNTWRMYSAFFGGKAAAYVEFHGPHKEKWSTMDIIAPFDDNMLPPITSEWYIPMPVTTTIDPREMIPDVKWTTGHTLERRVIPEN